MQKHIIKRDGLPPLVFTGEILSSGDTRVARGQSQNRWTEVTIYRTQGGKYVAVVHRRSQWAGENNHVTAAAHNTAAEVIQWLAQDTSEGGQTLGEASQEAVEKAARSDENFAAAWVESVD